VCVSINSRDFYDDIGIKVAYNLDEKIDIESYNN